MMDRRSFIMYGTTTAVLLGTGSVGSLWSSRAKAANVDFSLSINEADVEMVDGTTVFMWAFSGGGDVPRVPGPVLQVNTGDSVTISVTNNTSSAHGFEIPGIPGSAIASIASGQSATVTFSPEDAGSYMYIDPLNAPVNRVMGLHGALIVMPTDGFTSSSNSMPYTQAQNTAQIDGLFSALGSGIFPGSPWLPERTKVWLANQIDPSFNERVDNGETLDADDFVADFLPRYFTLNGLSGFYASTDSNTAPHGHVGEPHLIRTMNAGLAVHSPHIHGNHIYELSDTDANGAVVVNDNLLQRDTWILGPMDRKDVLLPFRVPPDIPPEAWPPSEESFPLYYPMHCHMEMSQTAAGGMYPMGMVTDWVLEGL